MSTILVVFVCCRYQEILGTGVVGAEGVAYADGVVGSDGVSVLRQWAQTA
jgi:hypothetical protein